MDKLKMHSINKVDDNIQRVGKLFPNCLTERINEKGEVEYAIDFDILRQELSPVIVEGNEERYQFTWPDKKKSLLLANAPIAKTLRPCREESVDFDNTENLYIEGDNLDVLKLLQETYLGKIKMIYIDPPYNTGNDFVYEDDFAQSTEEYLANSGQYDEEGNRLVQNNESNGRFHTDWLNMMYPRLKMAKALLADNGVIFISISDKEVHNLRKICDDLFGEKSFLSSFIWNSEGNTDNQLEVKISHEYILCYLKNYQFKNLAIGNVIDPNTREDSNLRQGFVDNNINKNGPANPPDIIELPIGFPCTEKELFYEKKILDDDFFRITREEKYISEEIKKKYNIENLSGLPVKLDDLIVSNYKLVKPCRIYGGFANRNKLQQYIDNNLEPIFEDESPIIFYLNTNAAVRYKKDNVDPRNILSVLRNFGTTEKTKTQLKKMDIYFSYPKPTDLLTYLVKIGGFDKDSIILDFFAGSCSTSHAIMNLNAEDGGHRKFIMVQLPEETDEKSEAFKAGYKNICEIGKERIRRVGKKIKEEVGLTAQNLDTGFRVLKLDSTNMKDVYYNPNDYEATLFASLADNIKADRTPEDLLFQVMLDLGVLLSCKIEEQEINGKKVFNVADGYLIACFDENVTAEIVKAIAMQKPYYFVMRDSSLADDSVATNFEQLFATYSPDTIRKVL